MRLPISRRLLLLFVFVEISVNEAQSVTCEYPADATATGCCGTWCASNTDGWQNKCGWTTKCAACAECTDPAITTWIPPPASSSPPPLPPNCEEWCGDGATSWQQRCINEAGNNCYGCAECFTPPPPTPPSSPPIFENTAQGQLLYLGGAAVFLLIIAVAAYMIHVRAKLDTSAVERWQDAEVPETQSKMRKRVGPVAKFFVSWVCIESGLGVVVQILNALATAQAGSVGSPVPYYFAFGLNVLMIVLETVEIRRTRKHSGVQTPWDRFWFGQWMASTPKNFYAKYTSRVLLGCEFYINLTALPVMIVASASVQADVSAIGQARMAKSLGGFNELKFIMGVFSLLETTGVTLLGPVLAKLPKRVRIGPLAATETYSARDWLITNALSFYFATLFYVFNYKQLMVCGWSPDESPWNIPDYPGGRRTMPPSPPSIPALDLIPPDDLVQAGRQLNTNSNGNVYGCTDFPRTFFGIAFAGKEVDDVGPGVKAGILLTFFALMLQMLAMSFILRNLYRKLPGWMAAKGEEGAEKTVQA